MKETFDEAIKPSKDNYEGNGNDGVSSQTMGEYPQEVANKCETTEERKTTEDKEYAVYTIVNHMWTREGLKLRVRWYGFCVRATIESHIFPQTSYAGIVGVYDSSQTQ